jgi:hypothetical protein
MALKKPADGLLARGRSMCPDANGLTSVWELLQWALDEIETLQESNKTKDMALETVRAVLKV